MKTELDIESLACFREWVKKVMKVRRCAEVRSSFYRQKGGVVVQQSPRYNHALCMLIADFILYQAETKL